MDVNNIFMIGKVSAIYPERATARVIFEDRDDMTSKELPIVFTRAFGVEIYAMPNVGEEVTCLFLPNGPEEGFIMGGYYNKKNPPPANNGNIKVIKFNSGDYIEYNETSGVFTIRGNVLISGELNVTNQVASPTFNGDLRGTADRANVAGGIG